jgi:hypothetical protein
MVEEVEVVDRHQPRGRRRNQKRVAGLDHVERGARERLHARPAQPVPRGVQPAHGHRAVDDGGAGDHVGREPIFPGRGKEREVLAGRGRGDQRAGGPVYVFADARPLTQGRTIIDEDPHGEADATTRLQLLSSQSIDRISARMVASVV